MAFFLPVCSITDVFRGKNPGQGYIGDHKVTKKRLELLLPGVPAIVTDTDDNGLGPDSLAVSPFRIF